MKGGIVAGTLRSKQMWALRKRSGVGRFAWVPAFALVVGVCMLMTTSPKTASDPVLPVQAGQAPVGQGSMVSGQVNGFSGSYSTSVPIEVLPGRNGLQPSISISYSSSVAHGLAGTGWGIPVSSIQRLGPGKGVASYGPTDRFFMSLNGTAVELLALDAPAFRDGTAYGTQHFRTKVETWSNVIAHYLSKPDPVTNTLGLTDQVAYWEVWTKSGERYYFGPLTEAETNAYSVAFLSPNTPTGDPRRNQWMLRLIEDVDDNTIEYRYSEGTASPGSLLLSEIQYGGNRVLGGYSHFASVRFVWESRPDKRFAYTNGVRQTQGDRLGRIEILFKGNVERSYWLHYDLSPWTGQSRLTSVTVNGAAVSYPKVEFAYADAIGTQPIVWAADSSPAASYPGRGLVVNYSKNTYFTLSEYAGTYPDGGSFMDLNGDGLPDKLDSYAGYDVGLGVGETPAPKIYLNRGPEGQPWQEVPETLVSVPGAPVAFHYVDGAYQNGALDTGVRFADITGDGVPEKIDGLVRADRASEWPLAVYLGRRDGTGWDDVALGAITPESPRVIPPAGCLPEPRYASSPSELTRPFTEQLRWGVKPRAETAGGKTLFVWQASPNKGSGQSYAIQTRLEGYEPSYTPPQPLYETRGTTYLASRCFENLPPGTYTFRVKLTWTKGLAALHANERSAVAMAAPMPSSSEELPYTFTVVPSADVTPPQVHFTQTPPAGFLEEAAFEWAGADKAGPVTFATWMAPKMAPSGADSTATREVFPLADLGVGGSFFVATYDAAGNMDVAEWAYDGGKIRPPVAATWSSGPNQTIEVLSGGGQYVDLNGDGYADRLTAYSLCQSSTWSCSGTVGTVELFNPTTFQWERAPEWEKNIEPLLGRYEKSDLWPAQTLDTGVRLMDANGDGLPDFVRSFYDEGLHQWTRWVRFNVGAGWGGLEQGAGTLAVLPGVEFAHYVWQSGNSISDRGAWLFDINGDGLPDKLDGWQPADTTLACPSPGRNPVVYLNRGTSFADAQIDFPEMSLGEFFRPKARDQSGVILSRDPGTRILDLNGDGLPDFVRDAWYLQYDPDLHLTCSSQAKSVYLAQSRTTPGADGGVLSPKPDYLIKVTSPVGGVTEIRYKSGADSYERILPEVNPQGDFSPTIPYVVESITQDDGRSHRYRTTYSYKHPKFDIPERAFAGFREVVATGPNGVRTVTTYHQEFPLTGMVEKSESYEALNTSGQPGGALFQVSRTQYESRVDEHGAWHVVKANDRNWVQQNGKAFESGVDYAYDQYDNPLAITTLGDLTRTDDDKVVMTTYINKEDEGNRRWLLGFVRQVDTMAIPPGGGAFTRTSSKRICYDGNCFGALSKGHVTQEENWLDYRTDSGTLQPFDGYLANGSVRYNPDGTLASRIDAAGVETTFDRYDDTKRYPLQKTVRGSYTTTVVPDPWGRPLSTTDAKSVTTSASYDPLGRVTEEWVQYPGMSAGLLTKRYFYHDELAGRPNEQYGEVHTFQENTQPQISKAYFDGLGRTYQTDASGFQRQWIRSEVSFDALGRKAGESRPHFLGKQVWWTTYQYDVRGRVVTETSPGAEAHTEFISPFVSEVSITGTLGEDGYSISHTKRTEVDAYGRLVWVRHDSLPAMRYTYDVMGALTEAWGESGGGWRQFVALTYDAWGHKLSYQDFDDGIPTTLTRYYYDTAGRLIKQREVPNSDPGQWRETNLFYGGELNQLTQRVGTDSTGAPPLTESLAYFGATQNLNAGEVRQRVDASGQYDFNRGFSGGRVEAQTSVWLVGASSPLVFREVKDGYGRSIQSDLPSGESVFWSYYGDSGLPSQVTDQTGKVLAEYLNYDESHLLSWKRGNAIQTTHTLDERTGRLRDVESRKSTDGALRQKLSYAYLPDGQIQSVTDLSPDGYSQSFSYDANMRLKTASSPGKYGTLNYDYDDGVSGGRLLRKGSYLRDASNQPANDQVELIYDQAFAHRVTATSDGRNFAYDAWGNVVREGLPDGTRQLYAYDAWNRMISVDQEFVTSPGDPRGGTPPTYGTRPLARYTYDASGERVQTVKYVGGIASLPLFSYRHVSAMGYEVEALEDTTVKTRWAIPGPNGLVCWKQKITAGAQFAALTAQRGHGALAGMAWENLWGDGRSLLAGGMAARWSAAKALAADASTLARHGYGALAANPKSAGNLALGLCVALGLALVVLPATRWGRKVLESLPTAEAQKRRGRIEILGARKGDDPARPWGPIPSPLNLFSVLPFLSSPLSRRSSVSSCLRGDSSSSPGTHERFTHAPEVSPPRLFTPWSPLPFRFAARLLIFLFVAQAGLFVAPLQVQAAVPVCEQTFYPLTDHLGTVNTLTDKDGNTVLSQHFLPFGEDYENPKSTVSTCNANEPWPYGFTGQHHDQESGLIYFHARYYNPATGHFMSADSVVPNPQDTFSYDRYGYCRNNPINLTDPTGHDYISAIIGAVIGFVMAIITGQNPLRGAIMGAIAGATKGAYGWVETIAMAAMLAAAEAIVFGGDPIRAAIIGAVSAGIGKAVGVGLENSKLDAGARSAVQMMAGGVVGGLTSVSMGGKFWQGFTTGVMSAGLSIAGNVVAGKINEKASAHDSRSNEGGYVAAAEPSTSAAGAAPIPTNQVGKGDSVLVVTAPDHPQLPARSDDTKAIVDTEPIRKNSDALISALQEKGANVTPYTACNGEDVNAYLAANGGQYDHIYVLGHSSPGGVYLGDNNYWTPEQIASIGMVAAKSFTWAVCWGLNPQGPMYLGNSVNAPVTYASYTGVRYNVKVLRTVPIGPSNVYQASGIATGIWCPVQGY